MRARIVEAGLAVGRIVNRNLGLAGDPVTRSHKGGYEVAEIMAKNCVRTLCVVVLCLLLAPAVGFAADPGADAFKRKDYPAAIQHWLPAAKKGSAAHQYNIGLAFEYLRKRRMSFQWYEFAAKQNYTQAIERLIVLPFVGGYDNDVALSVKGFLVDRARGPNAVGLYDLARHFEQMAYWRRDYKKYDTLDGTDMRNAWAFYMMADEAGHKTAEQEAERVWQHLTSKVGQDHARAQIGRWRGSFWQ
jgi:TPR repeat protein